MHTIYKRLIAFVLLSVLISPNIIVNSGEVKMMVNKYCNLDGTKKIKKEYPKINQGFADVEGDINTVDARVATHAAGATEKHAAEHIVYSGSGTGSNVKQAIDNLKADINNVAAGGTDHDPLVTASLVDTEGENFGEGGTGGGLDARLEKWEQKQLTHEADNEKHPTDYVKAPANRSNNIKRTTKYTGSTNWYGRRIAMIGDSHGWGQGAPNFQPAGDPFMPHEPWVHNDGFMDRLRKYLMEKFNSYPCISQYDPAYNGQEDVLNKELYNHTPKLDGGIKEYYNASKDRNTVFGAGNTSDLAYYGHNAKIGKFMQPVMRLSSAKAIKGKIAPGNASTFPAVIFTTNLVAGVGNTAPNPSYIFLDSATYAALSNNDVFYLGGIGYFKVIGKTTASGYYFAEIKKYIPNRVSSELPYFTLAELQMIPATAQVITPYEYRYYLDSYTRYVVWSGNARGNLATPSASIEGECIIEFELIADSSLGNAVPKVYVYADDTDYDSLTEVNTVKTNSNRILVDLTDTNIANSFRMVTLLIDFQQKKRGQIVMRPVGLGANAGITDFSTAVIRTHGIIAHNEDLIINWSMGAHSVGDWLGYGGSWDSAHDHIADIMVFMEKSITGAVIQAPIVNEYLEQTPIATFRARLDELVTDLGTDNWLLFTTLGKQELENGTETDTQPITYEAYFQALAEWAAAKGGNITYFDGRAYLKDYVAKRKLTIDYLFFDYQHPSALANELLTQALIELAMVKF